MTIELSSQNLRDRVLSAIASPLSKIGAEALDSFIALPLADEWRPKNMYLGELSKIFDIGLPFALLAGNASAEARRQEVGKAVRRGERLRVITISCV